ncbi:MAG: lysophospholipid acyltransferase family protein [Chthoniobacteraceae bacterium]
MPTWKSYRYRLEYAACSFLAWGIPKLSRGLCAKLARGLGTLIFWFDARGRAVALANLHAALGERADARAIVRESYRQFVRTMFDLFWSPALTKENVAQYIHHENLEVLAGLQTQKRGVIVMCVHNGGFEWASLGAGFYGVNGMIVTEDFKNPALAEIFKGLREVSGHQIIGQDGSILRLLKQVKRGGSSGVLIDLNLRPDQPAVVIDAMGMKMCVTFLHAVLADRGNAALLPLESELRPDGTCRVRFHPPLEPAPGATPQQIAQMCWDFYEPTIRAHPERWLWAYKHWRYKPKRTTREYPFYANESSKFEKLLKQMQAGSTGA